LAKGQLAVYEIIVCPLPFAHCLLLHQVGNERQHPEVTGALHGGGDAALVFQAIACDPARQQFALLIDELKQEVRILIVNILDAKLAETAVFFATQPDFRIAEKLYVFSGSSHSEW